MPRYNISRALKELQAEDPMNAVYTLKWGKSTTKIDGCPCMICKNEMPAGTRMWVLRNSYRQMRATVCPACGD